MKLHFIGFTAVIVLVILGISACVRNDLEELEEREKQIIEKYLAENNIPAESKTEGGIYFVEQVAGNGLTPQKDNYIVLNYVGRYVEDGLIRETNIDSLKDEWPVSSDLELYLYGPAKIIYGYSMPGINEALSMMREGGKATAILPSDKANYDYRPLVYELELIKVIGKIGSFEDSVLNVYSGSKYSVGDRIDTLGIWTRIDQVPSGQVVFGAGDTLYFNFTGKLVDGFGDSVVAERIFDSNEGLDPVKYIFGQTRLATGKMFNMPNQNTLPKGLKTAMDSLEIKSGMNFSVLLKYDQAFGENGILHPNDKYIIMPVYQNVEYNIEVTSIVPE